jgi:hypothetical protein
MILDIFIQNFITQNTMKSFQGYEFQAIIRPLQYLELTQQPYNSPWINFRKRSHFVNTNIIKHVKKSVKLDVGNICVLQNENVLNRDLIKKVGNVKLLMVFGAHCSFCLYNLI